MKLKVGTFEFQEWRELLEHGLHMRFRTNNSETPRERNHGLSEIWLHEPTVDHPCWEMEFFGRFRERFGKFERSIKFDEDETAESAKQKIDDLLMRLEKLESFQ